LSVTPTQRDVTASSGSATFAVSNAGTGTMNWTAAVTSGSWLRITSGASGTDSGTVNVSYDANGGTSSRTGTLQVTASGATGSPKTVSVVQAGTGGTGETILLPGGVPLEMVWVPGGTFLMGRYAGEQDSYSDEDPQHSVTLNGFWMGKYELTKAQWTAVMGTTPWSGQSYVLEDPVSPAVYVSWNMIAGSGGFIEKLNAANPGMSFRLPSETQWEYACRAEATTRFYWGDDPSYSEIGSYAWYEANAWNAGQQYAHVVGQKLPNAFGLYDMSGNVWEWCQDYWHGDYTGAPSDGSAWESPTSSYRVLRGGGWRNDDGNCRSAYRLYYYPDYAYSTFGFRIVRTP
jgi:formylglycine-generating enzyme required for sulfatase activity